MQTGERGFYRVAFGFTHDSACDSLGPDVDIPKPIDDFGHLPLPDWLAQTLQNNGFYDNKGAVYLTTHDVRGSFILNYAALWRHRL